jgi:hypothetical protein
MRILLLAAVVAITVSACVEMESGEDESARPTRGSGGGSSSDSDLVALVVATPRDHGLEVLVAFSSVAVVIVPSLRRKNGDDAPRTT